MAQDTAEKAQVSVPAALASLPAEAADSAELSQVWFANFGPSNFLAANQRIERRRSRFEMPLPATLQPELSPPREEPEKLRSPLS